MSLEKDYSELSLEEQAELKKLLSRYSAVTKLSDTDLESIAGGVSNEKIKKVLSYGIAALTGAGITVGGMALLHHNHHPHEGGPHAGTHFVDHQRHDKHQGNPEGMPPQGEHKGMPPQGEHRGMPPQGEHRGMPPQGEHKGMPPQGEHKGMPPQGEHKGMPPQSEHKGMPPQGEQHQTPEKQK